jgi:hypothetical protein
MLASSLLQPILSGKNLILASRFSRFPALLSGKFKGIWKGGPSDKIPFKPKL